MVHGRRSDQHHPLQCVGAGSIALLVISAVRPECDHLVEQLQVLISSSGCVQWLRVQALEELVSYMLVFMFKTILCRRMTSRPTVAHVRDSGPEKQTLISLFRALTFNFLRRAPHQFYHAIVGSP
jgi:hypothetical protein